MRLIGKLINEITAEDINYLKENAVQESINLDYKLKLPGSTDADKKELLADVSSFANTIGGTIVFGIKEEKDENGRNTGTPAEIVGLGGINADNEKLRLESIIREGLDPRLSNLVIRDIEVNGAIILLIGIPRSLLSPHLICFKGGGRFFVRNSAGKYQMDVREIKQAFLQAESWETATDNFRLRRIMEVRARKYVPNLDIEGSFFIHVLPLGPNRPDINLKLQNDKLRLLMAPPFCGGWNHRFNLDGCMAFDDEKKCRSYIQYFRNGGMEIYTSRTHYKQNQDTPLFLLAGDAEILAIKSINKYLSIVDSLEVEPPLILYISFTNLKDSAIYLPNLFLFDPEHNKFDREEILLPGIVIDSHEIEVSKLIKPLFNIIWQAAGWNGNPTN